MASLHEDIVPLAVASKGLGLTPLISLSGDGDFATEAAERLGMGAIRGSSSRGGAGALDAALELVCAGGRPGFFVDGPRGPRREPKPGAVVIAARAQAPLVALRARARLALRLPTWDRSCVPLPFAKVELFVTPVTCPPGDVDGALAALRAALVAPDGVE